MIRVAFFASYRFHVPVLKPICNALQGRAELLLSEDRRAIVTWEPHVLAVADPSHLEYFRVKLPGVFIVNVLHGLIGKRSLSRLPRRLTTRRFDAVAVGYNLQMGRFERAGARPVSFWETGYPQLDSLFRRDAVSPLPLDATRPTVLYAPTWNLGLTSATMLGDRLVELIRAEAPDVNILIKPHPVIGDWRPRWMARWARLAATHPGVHLAPDTHADIVPYLLASDILISDASSAIFEFLALDRPIILLTNPRHTADPAWAPDDIVWQWRDVGHEIHHDHELPAAVAQALGNPEAGRDRRQAYAQILFARFADGRSGERVAERILEAGHRVVDGAHAPSPPGPYGAYLWHDLRTRLRQQRAARRFILGPLETIRLAARGWRRPPPPASAQLDAAG